MTVDMVPQAPDEFPQAMVRTWEFNPEQLDAIAMAVVWYKAFRDRTTGQQDFGLAGYAGTGKTSCANEIAEQCCGAHRAIFLAYTGKAASRLRQKGCVNTKTLHQFLYNVRGEDEDGEPIFVAKGSLDERPLLIILDEASMVGEYDLNKLKQHGIPILKLGDHGQVPPVKAKQVFTKDTVDVTLSTIERNAGNIVRASMFVRQGKRLPPREYDDVKVRIGQPTDQDVINHCDEDGVMLCSYNNTRKRLNSKARRLLGFSGDLPQVGEKIVCTFNQHGSMFYNGEQAIVLGYEGVPDWDKDVNDPDETILVRIKSLSDGKEKTAKFNPMSFDKDEEIAYSAQRGSGGFDYGYALTIHKSQGSEWDHVILMEETLPNVPYEQMTYTGITRAIKHLMIFQKR